jgi:hypothetical protein
MEVLSSSSRDGIRSWWTLALTLVPLVAVGPVVPGSLDGYVPRGHVRSHSSTLAADRDACGRVDTPIHNAAHMKGLMYAPSHPFSIPS